jgi:menaquinone-dependent protoporphyrinogen oxidase
VNTLILFATKYGVGREIAQRSANKIDGAIIHDLKDDKMPAFDSFDCIIIGSSLYAGSIRKEAKIFLNEYTERLHGKTIGLFLSGLSGGDANSSMAGRTVICVRSDYRRRSTKR